MKAQRPKNSRRTSSAWQRSICEWAHDHRRDGTAQAKKARAKDEEAWTWKADAIGKSLAQHAPEIVVLQELGGEDEIYDIIAAIKESGPQYDYAYMKSEDPFTGHQVAVISTYPLTDARRLDIHLRRHVVDDVDLPDDQKVTVVAIHAPAYEEGIVRGTPDADDKRWSDIPVDERDVSDHLLVIAEIKRPKPVPEKSEDEAEDGDAADR